MQTFEWSKVKKDKDALMHRNIVWKEFDEDKILVVATCSYHLDFVVIFCIKINFLIKVSSAIKIFQA